MSLAGSAAHVPFHARRAQAGFGGRLEHGRGPDLGAAVWSELQRTGSIEGAEDHAGRLGEEGCSLDGAVQPRSVREPRLHDVVDSVTETRFPRGDRNPADTNQDGAVNSADITCVNLGIFGLPCPMPDCNEDGSVTSADITCVIIEILNQ